MIPFLLVCCAMFEFVKMVAAERFVGLTVRAKKIEEEKKVNEEKRKAGYQIKDPESSGTDQFVFLALMPIGIVYLFCIIWTAVFGENLYSQGLAVILLILSAIQSAAMKFVKTDSIKLRTTYTILDSFLSVVILCGMAYFYQKPM